LPKSVWLDPPEQSSWSSPSLAHPLLHEILSRRFATKQAALEFLDPAPLPTGRGEYLPNMAQAVQRISRAITDRERIMIFGDYDVDGVAATAIMVQALRMASNQAAVLGVRLPSRSDGYGLRPEGIQEAAATGATLMIAVDCASSDTDNVSLARNLGLDVVVFDHHQITSGPVDGIVVSPQLAADDTFRELSATGVVYLFALALAGAGYDLGAGPGQPPTGLLDLVSLGLIADVMPLTGTVRGLVRHGLGYLQAGGRPGLRALAQRAGIDLSQLSSEDVAFKLAPRLNAAGRMDDPRLALSLLLTEDPGKAEQRVARLEQINLERKAESNRMAAEAYAMLRANPELGLPRVVVVHRPDWHPGVVGIVAAKLSDSLGKPVIVLSDADGISRGSARSVPGFDIGRAIDDAAEILLAHGGHNQAAGLTIETARLPELVAMLETAAAAAETATFGGSQFVVDADVSLDQLNLATVDALSVLEPFGAGNPRPILRLRQARLNSYRSIGQDGNHLKLFLATGARSELGVLAWNWGHRSRELVGARHLDLLVTLAEDQWNGQRRLQAVLQDVRVIR
jgi:single-stranded-DNA-specific exonuclease